MSRLVFTIGAPRSGKSSYCKRLAQEEKLIILSADDFRLAITSERFNEDSELFVRASLITAAKALLISGQNVLIDETNSQKYHYLELLNLHKSPEIILFHTPPDVCKERAEDCNQRDLLPVIDRIEYNLQLLREDIVLGIQDKRINRQTVTEVGPIMYHLFSEDSFKNK